MLPDEHWQAVALQEGVLLEHMFYSGLLPENIERLASDDRFADGLLLVMLRSTLADGRRMMSAREIIEWRDAPFTPKRAMNSIFYYSEIRQIYPTTPRSAVDAI